MDEIDHLIEAFASRGRPGHSAWKLDILMDLGRFDDPRVADFCMAVVGDSDQPADVRAEAIRRLREFDLSPTQRVAASEVMVPALTCRSGLDLRLHAALALGDFVDRATVMDALGVLAADPEEPLELRYNAFTSLQRAGPTPCCLKILRGLASDEALGQSAAAVLVSWGTV